MKRWLCLALAGVGVSLLLAFVPQVGRGGDSYLGIACWGRSVGPVGRTCASLAPRCVSSEL